MIDKKQIEKRVDAGVKLLNKYDKHWRDKIIIRDLKMDDPCHCILGQLFDTEFPNGFNAGLMRLDILYPGRYGFDIKAFDSYAALKKEWIRRIKERKK